MALLAKKNKLVPDQFSKHSVEVAVLRHSLHYRNAMQAGRQAVQLQKRAITTQFCHNIVWLHAG